MLEERGLLIEDRFRAVKYLDSVGYFRLTGYMFHLQTNDGTHTFRKGTTFSNIIDTYNFDKKLRGVVLEYLERIEVCLRAKLTDKYSVTSGFFWYVKPENYESVEILDYILAEVKEKFDDPKEQFLKSFKFKYTEEDFPPSNMALEILSLGKLARLYKGLSNKGGKSEIAQEFNLPTNVITSWFIYLANVRNICAHHSRLWNRKVTVDRPTFPTRDKYKFKGENFNDTNTSLYGIISMMDRLLLAFNSENSFIKKIESLIDEFNIDCQLMGFPVNWCETANWKYK